MNRESLHRFVDSLGPRGLLFVYGLWIAFGGLIAPERTLGQLRRDWQAVPCRTRVTIPTGRQGQKRAEYRNADDSVRFPH